MSVLRPLPVARRSLALAAAVALLVIGAIDVAAVVSGPRDTAVDLEHIGTRLARTVSDFPVAVYVALVVVSVLHYVAAAVAARAAAGVRLPRLETVGVTLVSAAANRVSVGGVGGALVLGRFLTKRGGVRAADATAAVTALALIGGFADVIAFAVLIGVCVLFSAPHVTAPVAQLVVRVAALVPNLHGTVGVVVAAAGVVVIGVAAWLVRRYGHVDRVVAHARQFVVAVTELARSPRRLGALTIASASTTVVLAAGFALAATMAPTGLPVGDVGALMVGYMVSSAAGNAFPTPGGIGAADAAYVAVLTALGASLGHAAATVIFYRLLTFWLPAGLGLLLARPLRRRAAI